MCSSISLVTTSYFQKVNFSGCTKLFCFELVLFLSLSNIVWKVSISLKGRRFSPSPCTLSSFGRFLHTSTAVRVHGKGMLLPVCIVCVFVVCVSMQVYRLCERWDLTTGRPPCPLAISVPCLPLHWLRNDLGDRDHSLFVVSISHNWASVPEGQVYRIRTGLHNRGNRDTPLMWNRGCVHVSQIEGGDWFQTREI